MLPLDRFAENVHLINTAVNTDDSLFPLTKKVWKNGFELKPFPESMEFHTFGSLMGRVMAFGFTGAATLDSLLLTAQSVCRIIRSLYTRSERLNRDLMDDIIFPFIPALYIGRFALGVIHPGIIFVPTTG